MDFFEFALAFSITVALPLLILKSVLDYKREKASAQAEGRGALRVDELRQIIREAVEEATAPLAARIEALEGGALPEDALGEELLEEDLLGEEPLGEEPLGEEPLGEEVQGRTIGRRASA